ncbi:hypothetical protein FACS189483_01650 [Spirochaetia bacterium]|nr:hypothetical protein FACS189483_01650 [Spirochaetia bacterium]
MKRNKFFVQAAAHRAAGVLAALALVFGLVLAGCASGPPIPKAPLPQIPAGEPYTVRRAFPRSALLADNKAVSFRSFSVIGADSWQNFLAMDTPFVAMGKWADNGAKQAWEGKLEVLNQMLAAEWAANFGAELTFTTEKLGASYGELPSTGISANRKKVLAYGDEHGVEYFLGIGTSVMCGNIHWTDSTYEDVAGDIIIEIGLALYNKVVPAIGAAPIAEGTTFVEMEGIKDVAQFEELYDKINSQVITLLNYLLSTEGPVN